MYNRLFDEITMSMILKSWKETGTNVEQTFEDALGQCVDLTLEFDRVEAVGWTKIYEVTPQGRKLGIDGTEVRTRKGVKKIVVPAEDCEEGKLILIETEAEIKGKVIFKGSYTEIKQAKTYGHGNNIRAEWVLLDTINGEFYAKAPLECLFCIK